MSYQIIDATEPTALDVVGFLELGFGTELALAGNYTYVTGYEDGLHIIDTANRTAPTEVSSYDTPGQSFDVDVSGRYAYVADGRTGLRVIDVSNPMTPVEVGFFDPVGDVAQVAVAGHYVYISQCYLGVSIVDVADPTMPTEVGFFPTPGYCYPTVEVVGKYAYILADDILHIVDVADPAHPTEVAFYAAPNVRAYAVVLNHIYLVDGADGLVILRFSGVSIERNYLSLVTAGR